MLLAADFGTEQVFYSIFWFALFVIWIALIFAVLYDLLHADMSGWAKVAWIAAFIVLPYIGVFIYLIFRHDEIAKGRGQGLHARNKNVDLDPVSQTRMFG